MDHPDRPATDHAHPASGWRRRAAIVAALALTLAGTASACSSDDSPSAEEPSASETPSGGEATTTTGADAEDDGEDSGDDVALTSEDICDAVTVEAVAGATGLDITSATPSTSSTPQCAYAYASEDGPDSNLTVSASRYTSSDAQSIETAYDGAVRVNIASAGGTDVEQTDVDAGDEAVVLSGAALDLGMLRVGNVLASLIVPPDTISATQTEDLMVVLGDAFA